MELEFPSVQVNKMQRRKLDQQQQQQQVVLVRRKWSDWSECSDSCYKMRHRIDCEDLLLAQNSTIPTTNKNSTATSSINKKPSDYIKRQTTQEDSSAQVQESRFKDSFEEERDLLMKADQVDDDDYADEGDEEDQTDSCANVDPDKTYETKPCSGGKCRPSTLSIDQPLGVTNISPGFSNTRLRNPSKSGRYPKQQPKNQQNGPIYPSPPNSVVDPSIAIAAAAAAVNNDDNLAYGSFKQSRVNKLNSTSPIKGSKVNSNGLLKNGYYQQQQQHNNSSVVDREEDMEEEEEELEATQPFSMSNLTNETRLQSEEISGRGTNVIWPKATTTTTTSMWSPTQLLNSNNNSPQASLIQWTILIGTLLTIILLIMLILRKLFVATTTTLPRSYHWMLAKQTLKSSSKQRLGSSCSGNGVISIQQQQDPIVASNYSNMSSASGQYPLDNSSLLIDSKQRPPHHMCYIRRNQPNHQVSSEAAFKQHLLNTDNHFHQFVATNTSGCQLLSAGGSSAKFNTDSLDGVYMEPTVSHISGSNSNQRSSNRLHKSNKMMDDSLKSNYNTLGSGYYRNAAQIYQDCDKGFVLSNDFVAAPFAQSSASNSQHEHWMPSAAETTSSYSHCSTARRRKAMNSSSGSSKSRARKRSLNEVSLSHENVTAVEGAEISDQQEDFQQVNNSRSISISSSVDESPSVQSTTAQMLSNAASSSFEQTPEFEGSLALISHNASHSNHQVMVVDSNSVQASPASLGGGGKVRNNKVTCLMANQLVQSQPNSPMFVNQHINNRNYKCPQQTSGRSIAHNSRQVFSSRARELALDNRESDYAQPEVQFHDNTSTSRLDELKGDEVSMVNEAHSRPLSSDCDSDSNRHFYEEINQHRS